MNNELIELKSWWKRNWKGCVPVSVVVLFSVGILFSSGMSGVAIDLVQAYANTELYKNAIERANTDENVSELLGKIKPMDKLAILEGEAHYSNKNKTVNSTIWIYGSKGRAKLDLTANRIEKGWKYTKINVRIKNPPEKRQTIVIATVD